ncbi:MAG: biopolymer transporter ExbD [Verrucomicrobiales bacterium]|jgi:biopolymer transport protein ExbD|nr:biopolymer transporter ExbD [Verrucomicrobiales bacterium]
MQFYTKRRRMPVINVVSLIDVFCLLLIFYIVTTTFKQPEPAVQIKVPASSTAQPEGETAEPVVIYATKGQDVYIGAEAIPIAQLGEALRLRKADAPHGFALKADTDVPLGFFVKVMDAAKEAGITDLSMFTEEPKSSADDAD